MTRLVCIGDIHFGPGHRNEDRYASLDQIIGCGERLNGLGAWIFAGDLNHAKMTIEDRNRIAERLGRMGQAAPIVLLEGNHDHPGDLAIFAKLKSSYPIVVVDTPRVVRLLLPTGEYAALACLPYPRKAGLVAAGVAHEDLGAEARAAFDAIFLTMQAELAAAGGLPLFLGHVTVGGAVASTGQPVIGVELELDAALLSRFGRIPKILGHIHKHQRVHDAVYLGSISRNDFGEREEKVFGVVEYDTPETWRAEFFRLKIPGQHLVEGDLAPSEFVITSINGAPPSAHNTGVDVFRGADVRARYRYKQADHAVLDVSHIEQVFAVARSLKLDPWPQHEAEVRAPEIVAATTLEAKLQAYCARMQVDWTEGLAEKAGQLQRAGAEQPEPVETSS